MRGKMKEEVLKRNIVKIVNDVKTKNPMCPSITNSVTINLVANAQIAVGGSAAMVYFGDEAITLGEVGQCFYINVGTLLPIFKESLPTCCKYFYENDIPWVLDPVAVGVGSLRTELLTAMKEWKPSIIRGNPSEIIALARLWELEEGQGSNVRGVDSTDEVETARSAAIALAKYTGGAVAASGEVDLITDGKSIVYSYGGSKYMDRITGAGCSLGGVCGIYLSQGDPLTAAVTAHNIYNLAAKRAEEQVDGPGSFEVYFLDELYKATAEEISNVKMKKEELE